MRSFYCLAFNSIRNDLMSVVDYEVDCFDLTVFWRGTPFRGAIPDKVRLYCDSVNHGPTDYVGNPLSWPICSQKLVDIIQAMDSRDVEFFKAPLFESGGNTPIPCYQVMNVIRTVSCLDLDKSKLSYSPDRSKITGVFEHVLTVDSIPSDAHIFRLQEWMHTIIVSDEMAQAYVGKGLKGIAFIRLRSSSRMGN